MRYAISVAGLAVFLAASFAQAQGLGQYQYKSRSNIQVGRGGYSDVTSPSFSPLRRSGGFYGGHHDHDHHHHGHRRHYYGGYGYPYYGGSYYGGIWGGSGLTIGLGLPGYGFSYSAGWPYGYGHNYGYSGLAPYGTYYRPGDQYLEYYLPPTQPAELQYGPQAVKQFLGLPRNFATEPQRNAVLDAIAAPLPSAAVPLRNPDPVTIEQPNLQEIDRADHFIQSGDRLFQQQRYQEALGRYKDAVAAAPGYADAHLRKGLAYLATNRPEEAVESLKLAVQQNPNVADTAMTLDGLLGANGLAKSALLEANARRAVADPQNSDLLFAVGVLLYFDGQQAEAAQTLAAARNAAGGGELPHIDAFAKHLAQPTAAPGGLDL